MQVCTVIHDNNGTLMTSSFCIFVVFVHFKCFQSNFGRHWAGLLVRSKQKSEKLRYLLRENCNGILQNNVLFDTILTIHKIIFTTKKMNWHNIIA